MLISVSERDGHASPPPRPAASVDTVRLSAIDARRLEQLVRESGFFRLPAEIGLNGHVAIRREVAVRDGSREHRVTFVCDGTPATEILLRLIQTVKTTAASCRRIKS